MVQIAVYNSRGGVGKDAISLTTLLTMNYVGKDAVLITNELDSSLSAILPKEKVLVLDQDQDFPNVPEGWNVVYNLAGTIDGRNIPVIKRSDYIVVPINNETDSYGRSQATIERIYKMNENIIIVGTKIEGNDFSVIKKRMIKRLGQDNSIGEEAIGKIPFFPLRRTKAFKYVAGYAKSIRELISEDKMSKNHWSKVSEEFDAIFNYMMKEE